MKIRNGFVSNSSSSSFILHKSEVGEEKFKKIINFLKKYEIDNSDTYEGGWGDNGDTFTVYKNYLEVQIYYINDNYFFDTLKDLGLTNENFYKIDN